MNKTQLNILVSNSGKSIRTVTRAIKDLELSREKAFSSDVLNLVVVYLKIEGARQGELRLTLKKQLHLILAPKTESSFDGEFKDYLLAQSKQKDKQLKKKEKQISKYAEAIVGLSNNLLTLVDDISMLRVQDTGTLQRLYDKNVLADLLTDLKQGSPEHTAVKQLLKKANQQS